MIMETDQRTFVCLINDAHKILVIKRALETNNGGQIGLPGGRLNEGETILEGAKREVFEELGIDLDLNKTHLTIKVGKRSIIFMRMPASDSYCFKLDLKEVSAVHYCTLQELILPDKYQHTSLAIAVEYLVSIHLVNNPSPGNIYELLSSC